MNVKLTAAQLKAVELLKDDPITVTYWGGKVWSMSTKSNDATLKALVNKGIVDRKYDGRDVVYTLKEGVL